MHASPRAPWRFPFVAAALAVLLPGCGGKPPPEVTAEPPRPVRTVVVQPVSTSSALQLPGEVRPRIESRLGFRIGGKVAQRTVSVGDRVSPGQVLARLDSTDLTPALTAQQAQVQAARTDLELARVELERLRDLRAKHYISQAALDRQQAGFDAAGSRLAAAEAQVQQARNALDFQVLRADAAGVVTAVEAEAGQVVAAGQAVIRIAHAGEREIAVNVPEGSLQLVRSTREWAVAVPSLGGRVLPGRLRELSPVADPASRTYAARIAVAGDQDGLALGMTATVRALRPDGTTAFVLPLSALQSADGEPRVWRVDPVGNTVAPVAVRTDGYLDDAVRIVAGVSPGDRIVTGGANLLRPGQSVRLVEGEAMVPAPAAGAGTRR